MHSPCVWLLTRGHEGSQVLTAIDLRLRARISRTLFEAATAQYDRHQQILAVVSLFHILLFHQLLTLTF